jgi:FkbM family methyltransferase
MGLEKRSALYRSIDTLLMAVLRRLPSSSLTRAAALNWGYRFRPEPREITLRSGLKLLYDEPDYIPLLLYYTGAFEPHVVDHFRSILGPGDTVLDVGANIGSHTLELWNIVGRGGRVISVEASPLHSESVKRNLALNELPVDDVVNVAVGDRQGEACLGLPASGNKGMFGINAGPEGSFQVAMTRIDDLLAARRITDLALIKMDIEGSEHDALRGAADSLSRYRPALVVELNDVALQRCGSSSAEVVSFLEGAGYRGWIISSRAPQPIRAAMTHECDECLFVPIEAKQLWKKMNLRRPHD